MKIVRCEKGHVYDSDRSLKCPYCESREEPKQKTEAITEVEAKKHIHVSWNGGFGGMSGSFGGNEDVTQGYYQVKSQAGEKESRNQQSSNNPVVGWLVCIEGGCRGRSYELFCGQNFIGRSEKMDVSLTGDISVSRERHAVVIYEPKENRFYVQPGDAHNLFYVNEKVVLTNQELHQRDEIQLGESRLIFIEFCGNNYKWDFDKN